MLRKNVLPLFLCVLFMVALGTLHLNAKASPTIIKVPQDYTTIQEAINQANPNDTIQVSSGTYQETLFINKTLTLIGEDKNNTIIEGSGCEGAVIQANSTTVNISGFTVRNGFNGILLEKCSGSVITRNNVNAAGRSIWLHYSHNNTVSDNTAMGGNITWRGIVLCGQSSNNTIIRNTIKDNAEGLGITGQNNLIIHNNFINNKNQTNMIESHYNMWNNTYEGNYWSNYNGTDADQDGIGDTPYPIDENNQDNHPLMGTFHQFKIQWQQEIHTLTTICNSTLTNFNFSTIPKNAIIFNVTGPEGTTGLCRIIIPHALLNDNYTILIDGSPPLMEKELPLSNSTHTYLYFTYIHTTHQVTIIPEFPTTIILTIAIILALSLTYLVKKVNYKDKQNKPEKAFTIR